MKASSIASLMILFMTLGSLNEEFTKEEIPLEVLKAEYLLIQAKKSKLSANQRRAVVSEYERRAKATEDR